MSEAHKIGKAAGNRGKGRPKGAINKTTRAAKEAIAFAADQLGGAERLVDWVKEDPENEKVFWSSIYTKLLPYQVEGNVGLTVKLESDVTKL